jgi:hypothetical protein
MRIPLGIADPLLAVRCHTLGCRLSLGTRPSSATPSASSAPRPGCEQRSGVRATLRRPSPNLWRLNLSSSSEPLLSCNFPAQPRLIVLPGAEKARHVFALDWNWPPAIVRRARRVGEAPIVGAVEHLRYRRSDPRHALSRSGRRRAFATCQSCSEYLVETLVGTGSRAGRSAVLVRKRRPIETHDLAGRDHGFDGDSRALNVLSRPAQELLMPALNWSNFSMPVALNPASFNCAA